MHAHILCEISVVKIKSASFLNSLTLLQIGMEMGDLGAHVLPRCDEGGCLEPGAAQVMCFGVSSNVPFEYYGCRGADMKKPGQFVTSAVLLSTTLVSSYNSNVLLCFI